MWGATGYAVAQNVKFLISIHAPRVGSDDAIEAVLLPETISIHAPRVGSDRAQQQAAMMQQLFQSTLPVWGATGASDYIPAQAEISIHAPRVGSDSRNIQRYSRKKYMILCIAQNLKCLLLLIAPFLEYFTVFSQKSGANLPEKPWALFLRTTIKSWAPPGDKCFYSRNVQFFSRIDFPGNKTAGCPFPGP